MASVIPACAAAPKLRPENAITFGCAEKLLEVAKEQEKKTSKLSSLLLLRYPSEALNVSIVS